MPTVGVRFRQDNDFFYFTGNEDLNAVLLVDLAKGESHLFLPTQGASEIRSDGRNWLTLGDQATPRGFTSIQPLPMLTEVLARLGGGGPQTLWVRLSERDEVDDSRGGVAINHARRMNNPWGGQPSEDAWRIETLRQPVSLLRAARRRAGGRRAAGDQDAARDRGPDAQRPPQRRGDPTRDRDHAAGTLRVRARGRGDLSPVQERRPGQRLSRHRRQRTERATCGTTRTTGAGWKPATSW